MDQRDYTRFAGGIGFSAENLKPFAASPNGVAFLEKYLHPPGPPIKTVEGLPDRDAQASVAMEFRNAHTVAAPALATNTWDVLIVSLPGTKHPVVYWAYPTGSSATGIVPANMSFVNNNVLPFTPNDANDLQRVRTFAKSLTVYFNAPALSDQGTVYAAQTRIGTSVGAASTLAAGDPRVLFDFGTLSGSGENILMLSPKAYMGKARDGIYVSHGYSEPVIQYQSVLGNRTDGSVATPRRYIPGYQWHNLESGADLTEFDPNRFEMPASAMTTGVILFTGMALTTTLELKVYEDIEGIAAPNGHFAPFMTPGAEPDEVAMESAYKIRYHMSDAYPSALNFLGALGALLPKILPVAGSILSSLFGPKNTTAVAPPVVAASVPTPRITPRPQAAPRQPVPLPRLPRPVPAPRTVYYPPVTQVQPRGRGRNAQRRRPRGRRTQGYYG